MLENIIGHQANNVLKTFTYSCNDDQVKVSQMNISDLFLKKISKNWNIIS